MICSTSIRLSRVFPPAHPFVKSSSTAPLRRRLPVEIRATIGSSSFARTPSKTLSIKTRLNLPVSSYIVRVCLPPAAIAVSTSRRTPSTIENSGARRSEWRIACPRWPVGGIDHETSKSRSRGSKRGKIRRGCQRQWSGDFVGGNEDDETAESRDR